MATAMSSSLTNNNPFHPARVASSVNTKAIISERHLCVGSDYLQPGKWQQKFEQQYSM